MAWFDNYAQGYFKTLGDGRLAFYPYSLARRGYVVSGEQRTALRRFMFGAGMVGPLLGVMTADAIRLWNFPINLVLVVLSFSLLFSGYYGGLRWMTRNLEHAPADEQPTIGERYRTRAQHVPWILLWSNEIVGVAFVMFGLISAATGWRGQPLWMGLVTAATGGLLASVCGYMLWAKWARTPNRA